MALLRQFLVGSPSAASGTLAFFTKYAIGISPHTAVVVDENGISSKPVTIEVSIAGYEKLVELATGGAEGCQGEVVMEATGDVWLPLTAFLNSRGVPVVMGPGKKVSDLRKFYRRYAKTDSIDAEAMGRLPEVDPVSPSLPEVPHSLWCSHGPSCHGQSGCSGLPPFR